MTNDYDTLNEFANSCRYIDHISELVPGDMDLTLLHLNIRSILNKQDELKNLLSSNDIDICSLNETWLDNTTKNQVQVSRYVLESSECKNKSGGGVGILVGDHLKYKRWLDLENFDLELCIVEILGKNGNLIVCSLYQAPNTKKTFFLENTGNYFNVLVISRVDIQYSVWITTLICLNQTLTKKRRNL